MFNNWFKKIMCALGLLMVPGTLAQDDALLTAREQGFIEAVKRILAVDRDADFKNMTSLHAQFEPQDIWDVALDHFMFTYHQKYPQLSLTRRQTENHLKSIEKVIAGETRSENYPHLSQLVLKNDLERAVLSGRPGQGHIVYNEAYNHPFDFLFHAKLQCHSGANALMLFDYPKRVEKRSLKALSEMPVMIFNHGHLQYGYLKQVNKRHYLFGVEMTASGSGLVRYKVPTSDIHRYAEGETPAPLWFMDVPTYLAMLLLAKANDHDGLGQLKQWHEIYLQKKLNVKTEPILAAIAAIKAAASVGYNNVSAQISGHPAAFGIAQVPGGDLARGNLNEMDYASSPLGRGAGRVGNAPAPLPLEPVSGEGMLPVDAQTKLADLYDLYYDKITDPLRTRGFESIWQSATCPLETDHHGNNVAMLLLKDPSIFGTRNTQYDPKYLATGLETFWKMLKDKKCLEFFQQTNNQGQNIWHLLADIPMHPSLEKPMNIPVSLYFSRDQQDHAGNRPWDLAMARENVQLALWLLNIPSKSIAYGGKGQSYFRRLLATSPEFQKKVMPAFLKNVDIALLQEALVKDIGFKFFSDKPEASKQLDELGSAIQASLAAFQNAEVPCGNCITTLQQLIDWEPTEKTLAEYAARSYTKYAAHAYGYTEGEANPEAEDTFEAPPVKNQVVQWFAAVASNELEAVENLVRANPSLVNLRDPVYKTTALIMAIQSNFIELAHRLFENHDADPSMRDGNNWNAYMHAAYQGRMDLIHTFYAQKFNDYRRPADNLSDLDLAARRGHWEIVFYLLDLQSMAYLTNLQEAKGADNLLVHAINKSAQPVFGIPTGAFVRPSALKRAELMSIEEPWPRVKRLLTKFKGHPNIYCTVDGFAESGTHMVLPILEIINTFGAEKVASFTALCGDAERNIAPLETDHYMNAFQFSYTRAHLEYLLDHFQSDPFFAEFWNSPLEGDSDNAVGRARVLAWASFKKFELWPEALALSPDKRSFFEELRRQAADLEPSTSALEAVFTCHVRATLPKETCVQWTQQIFAFLHTHGQIKAADLDRQYELFGTLASRHVLIEDEVVEGIKMKKIEFPLPNGPVTYYLPY